jgi:hypothetical protein
MLVDPSLFLVNIPSLTTNWYCLGIETRFLRHFIAQGRLIPSLRLSLVKIPPRAK